jgi:hypothetical protein
VQFSASRRKHRTHHPDERFGSTKRRDEVCSRAVAFRLPESIIEPIAAPVVKFAKVLFGEQAVSQEA